MTKMMKTVAWEMFSGEPRAKWSRLHLIDPSFEMDSDHRYTLCGSWVPQPGEGIDIVIDQVYRTMVDCKRCKGRRRINYE